MRLLEAYRHNVSRIIVEVHPWRQIVSLISYTLSLRVVQEVSPLRSILKHSIKFACRFLREAKKDGRSFLGDADYDQDGENHDEHGAEGEAELALVPANVLARLFGEEAKLLPAGQTPLFALFLVLEDVTVSALVLL